MKTCFFVFLIGSFYIIKLVSSNHSSETTEKSTTETSTKQIDVVISQKKSCPKGVEIPCPSDRKECSIKTQDCGDDRICCRTECGPSCISKI